MKTSIKSIVMLTAALLLGAQTMAQVVETTTYDDGRVYTGQRDGKGKINGKGLMTWPNGDRYDGEWKKGLQDGEGTYTHAAAGYSYTGQWKKGYIKGHGTFRFNNGNVMEGDWTAMGTGTGYLLMPDGTRYDGPFLNGRCNGQGVMTWANGDRFEGTFANGQMNGMGTINFRDGTTYTGNWVNGHRTGQGKCVYSDGSHYTGGWANDQFEGEGTYVNKDGVEIKGTFHAGELQQ